MLRLQPCEPRLLILWPFLLHNRNPLFQRTPRCFLQLRQRLLHHRHARMHAIQRFTFRSPRFWHSFTSNQLLRFIAPFDFLTLLFFLKYPMRSSTARTISGSATVASSNTSANRPPSSGGTNLPHETASV